MVSSVAGARRTDGRMTENISERCRPTTVALRYNSLESQQWVDAKEAIEDGPGSHLEEGTIVSVLCHALMVSPQSLPRQHRHLFYNRMSVLPCVCVCVCDGSSVRVLAGRGGLSTTTSTSWRCSFFLILLFFAFLNKNLKTE